jgi:hypothetical protein
VLEGPDHVIQLANTGYLKLVGHRACVAAAWPMRYPSRRRKATWRSWTRSTGPASRTRHSAPSTRCMPLRRPSDERYLDFVYQPMTGRDGSVIGILVQGVDVTARATSERALAAESLTAGLRDAAFGSRLLVLRPALRRARVGRQGQGALLLPADRAHHDRRLLRAHSRRRPHADPSGDRGVGQQSSAL